MAIVSKPEFQKADKAFIRNHTEDQSERKAELHYHARMSNIGRLWAGKLYGTNTGICRQN